MNKQNPHNNLCDNIQKHIDQINALVVAYQSQKLTNPGERKMNLTPQNQTANCTLSGARKELTKVLDDIRMKGKYTNLWVQE